ncbi:MAG TPA: hypothetical protein VI524_09520 [Anaerolineales bacterium]|nr:hypothetical protein [Anaerolineales bacterium]
MFPGHPEIGVGATEALSLRVSVGTLVGVLFDDPESGQSMLALERTATLREVGGQPEVIVRAKPFGGAVRLLDPQALERLIGAFHYDSERSRQENDFRLQIQPAAWDQVKDICRRHLNRREKSILDPNPERELAEEFADALHVRLSRNHYHLKSRGASVEDLPVPTDNPRAEGMPTAWFYYLFEARVAAPEIIAAMLANTRRYSDHDLEEMAWENARQGGRGRANGILTTALDDLKDAYRSVPAGRRGEPVQVAGHPLDRSVLALLEGIGRPYRRATDLR